MNGRLDIANDSTADNDCGWIAEEYTAEQASVDEHLASHLLLIPTAHLSSSVHWGSWLSAGWLTVDVKPHRDSGSFLEKAIADLIGRTTPEVVQRMWDLPRSEPLFAAGLGVIPEPTQVQLAKSVHRALDQSKTDWRTVASLAHELDVSEADVEAALLELGDNVRRPIGQELKYSNWYRLRSAGLTWQEKLSRFKAIVTFRLMDDDY